jgi:hypothetical protein
MCRLLERRISEERSNGCEAEIPGPHRGGSLRLEDFQECADERSVQIPQCQLRWGPPKARLRERKQEPERVAIGGNGVGTYTSMLHEPICEPPLDQHG